MMMLALEKDFFLSNIPHRRKVTQEQLWETIRITFPMQGTSENWRQKLKFLLDALVTDGAFSLPMGKKSFDLGNPPLPKWILRNDIKKQERDKLDSYLWTPELAFLSECPLEVDTEWLKVDVWLKAGGKYANFVPQKERSIDIFCDEKRLDIFLRKSQFKSGLISRDTLRCYYVPEPICCVQGPSGSINKSGLVVENATTFSSLCEFNKSEGRYGFIAYGGGNSFISTVEGLMLTLKEYGHSNVLYFGDIDWDGLQIMLGARKKLRQEGFELEADKWLYRLLVENGKGKKFNAARHRNISSEMREIMPIDLVYEIETLIAAGLRLPQELVGKMVLTQQVHIEEKNAGAAPNTRQDQS